MIALTMEQKYIISNTRLLENYEYILERVHV
jgi:hypothetical protein